MTNLPTELSPATRAWFADAWQGPTKAQAAAWPAILSGEHALVIAPTGSGKTLAAFLCGIDRCVTLPDAAPPGVRVLYISPLKALVVDVERNLRAPLVGIERTARLHGERFHPTRVDVRSGDTRQDERARQRRNPAEILVTTPESLYLLLTSQAREALRTVEMVIVDEVHALAGTKRGVHLQLSLERLSLLTERPVQRIGLSATVRPAEVACRFLAGSRPVTVVDTSEPPHLDLAVIVPVDDMEAPPLPAAAPRESLGDAFPGFPGASGQATFQYPTNQPRNGLWPSLHPVLLAEIRAHRSTLVFANSRLLCERLCRALNELAGTELVRAHHGSVSHEQRAQIEDQLKAGMLPAIVATSSLELGIDMGAIDLVLLVESPGSVASGLQRVGRAGHQVGAVSRGRILPKHRGDLLESAVVARRMIDGKIETTHLPRLCLDVLAQQVVAMVVDRPWQVDELLAVLQQAGSFVDLSRPALDAVLDMLSGRYTSDELAELRPSLNWDRALDLLTPRKAARLLAVLNGGTIPDRGYYRVRNGPTGPRVGELDEEMVYESRVGDVIVLGATSWRIDDIRRDDVVVSPSPGRAGRLPFWKGESPGRPIELGMATGAFLRELMAQPAKAREAWVQGQAPLDARAARNLVAYVTEQHEATGGVPTDRAVTVERFRDELGDWRVCLLTPFGARVHAPWALAIEAGLTERTGVKMQALWSDDGITLRIANSEDPPAIEHLFPDPDTLEEVVVSALRDSAVFVGRFRENAARALLLPRRTATGRSPLWLQRRRSEALLASVSRHPSFPIVLETYREVMQDVFDLPATIDVLRQIRSRVIRVDEVVTRSASPFARSLAFQYAAAFLYDGDQPTAERRVAALSLDRKLLAELLGQQGLRDLLDGDAIDEVESELQALVDPRRCAQPEHLHDLLRRLGDLTDEEVTARCVVDPAPWLAELHATRRAIAVRICGESRWIAVEDAARYRDALGVPLPASLPESLLTPVERPVESLVRRYARHRGPFVSSDLARRYGWTVAQAELVLRALEASGELVHGELSPARTTPEWCDADVLRRIQRRTLARLRREVEPVPAEVFAAFLPVWQGVVQPRSGPARLAEVVAQLEGLPLAMSELEARILPARVRDYQPMHLDQLGAFGEVVWVGRGALGARDGLVALYRRERLGLLLDPPAPLAEPRPEHTAILAALDRRGACFFVELVQAAGGDTAAVTAALFDLVWAGLVSNDTLQPLRAFVAGQTAAGKVAGGRWSRVDPLGGAEAPPATAQAHARVMMLLDRYGIVSRETAALEDVPGGWTALYAVLGALEEAGRVRRGYFVEGLASAQFASPGAVDRLRALREPSPGQASVASWVASADPANAWGGLLSWPPSGSRPRRVAGARVGLLDGAPVCWLAPGARHLVLFEGAAERLPAVIAALSDELGYRSLQIDKVDGAAALGSPALPALVAAGFQTDFKGLVLSRPTRAAGG